MNAKLEQAYAQFLAENGALEPTRLGGTKNTSVSKDSVNRFMLSLESCKALNRRWVTILLGIYVVLLIGVLAVLISSQSATSSATLVALLGTSGIAGLAVIPIRMQTLLKDLVVTELTLAMLPGRLPEDQLDLVKSLHVATKSQTSS